MYLPQYIVFAQTGSKVPLLSSLRSTWKQSRLCGVFAGNGANCMRVFPFAGLVCLTYANIAHVSVWNINSSFSYFWCYLWVTFLLVEVDCIGVELLFSNR